MTPKPSDAAFVIGVEVDPTVPPGEAELRDGERVVGRIVGLDQLHAMTTSVLDGAAIPPQVWHVVSSDDLLAMLRRVAAGEDPAFVYLEEYVNADRDEVSE